MPNNPYSTSSPGARRASLVGSLVGLTIGEKDVPVTFPMQVWNEQSMRYLRYWQWFDGTMLNETRKVKSDNKEIEKYPLKLNPIRDFARKHAALLLGEEGGETPYPMIRPLVTPKAKLNKEEYDEKSKEFANFCENVLNEVWMNSYGRAIQMENAVLQQFLGGCVFQASYIPLKDPRRKKFKVPIIFKNILPDFFVPVWQSDDFWDLLEGFVVYRIPAAIAYSQFGYKATGGSVVGWVNYCEHWTRTSYSIFLNNQPLVEVINGEEFIYKDVPNDFGFVPFVYIPHTREGEFFGPSHVDDLEGLVKEFNARIADLGDAIRDSVHRQRYTTDVANTKPKQLGNDVWATDLGQTNIATKATPNVITEDPPSLGEGLTTFSEEVLWRQILRVGHMSNIAFGEDDVSQRSAIALAMRMFPTTAHSRQERTYWTEGLNLLGKMALRMLNVKKVVMDGITIPDDFEAGLHFAQDWLPQIPRDREQQVNEVILRFQAGLLSPERALATLGDTEYIDEEITLIKNWLTFQAGLGATSGPAKGAGTGAAESMLAPKASDGMEE